MARSDGRRLLGAAAFVACVVAAAACAPPIPLERLRCPCLGARAISAASGSRSAIGRRTCRPPARRWARPSPATAAPTSRTEGADAPRGTPPKRRMRWMLPVRDSRMRRMRPTGSTPHMRPTRSTGTRLAAARGGGGGGWWRRRRRWIRRQGGSGGGDAVAVRRRWIRRRRIRWRSPGGRWIFPASAGDPGHGAVALHDGHPRGRLDAAGLRRDRLVDGAARFPRWRRPRARRQPADAVARRGERALVADHLPDRRGRHPAGAALGHAGTTRSRSTSTARSRRRSSRTRPATATSA